jgi:hypothetical protein
MTEKPEYPVESEARMERLAKALSDFLIVLKREHVPCNMDVPDAFSGLTDDEKRALFLLQKRSARRNARKTATGPDALSKARRSQEDGKPGQAVNTKAGVDPGAGTPLQIGKEPETTRSADPDPGPDKAPEDPPARPLTPSPERTRDGGDPAEGASKGADRPDSGSASRDPDPAVPEARTPQERDNSAIADVPGMGQSFPLRPLEIRLPNARVRQAYSAASDRPVLKVIDDAGSGLSVDADGGLSGTPECAGDHVLSLEIADPDGSPRPATARLTVIADPRDLWVSHPSDRSDPYWKEDGVVLTRSSPEAFLLAGSLRGRGHAQKGGFREDDVALRVNDAGWHILVVADGAGSAKLSRQASRIAVEVAADAIDERTRTHLGGRLDGRLASWSVNPDEEMASIRRDLLYPVLAGAALKATNALVEESKAKETDFREYSTTLLCAIAKRTTHGWILASFSVGDGGIAAFDAETGRLDLLCTPDSGEYAGQTHFLTPGLFEDPQSAIARIHCVIRPAFTGLVAMSDGITDPFFPTDAMLEDPGTWSGFWAGEVEAGIKPRAGDPDMEARMIDWLGFWSKGNHDDRTIALLIPETGA